MRDVSPKVPPVWVKDPLVVTAPREISVPLASEADADPLIDSDCTVKEALAKPTDPPEATVKVLPEPLPPVMEKRPLGRTEMIPKAAVPSVISRAAKALELAEPDPMVADPVRRTPPESVKVPVRLELTPLPAAIPRP